MRPRIVPADAWVEPPRIFTADEWMKPPMRSPEERDREYFEHCIKEMEEEETEEEEEEEEKRLPKTRIVLYHDLLDKLWGWDRLVPFGRSVSWSDYCRYLEALNYNTKTAAKSLSIAAIAETISELLAAFNKCCKKEEELVRNFRKMDNMKMILPKTRSIILSCLIHQCANSEKCTSSVVSNAALWCMTKEADLTLELLRHGADPSNDSLVDRSSNIRICALSLMNCTLHSSAAAAAASGAMLGIAKEAEMMCEWMGENHMLLDFCDDDIELSTALVDGNIVRWRTLDVMFDMLEESAADASGCGGGRNIDAAAKTNGGNISDTLHSQYQKIKGLKGIEKQEKKNDHFLTHLWGKLLPRSHFVEWSDYINYLAEYYIQNAFGFLDDQNIEEWLLDPPARAVQMDTTNFSSLAAAVAYHCVKMDEELVSKWKTRVPRKRSNTFSISTIIESSLITERALAICSTRVEISVPSAIAFVCIDMEADLMCELLKRGADPNDNIIKQSRVIRMCALGLANLRGHQSNVSAAAMLGIAKEAKRMSDWMRRVKKLFTLNKFSTFCLSERGELVEGCLIRTRTLDVMTRILLESSFP